MSSRNKKPWDTQSELLARHIPTEDEIVQTIINIRDVRCQALVAALFLTGCRIEEIIPYQYRGVYKDNIDYSHNGITISSFKHDGNDWVKIKTRVSKSGRVPAAILKNKDTVEGREIFLREKEKKLRHRYKEIPIYCPDGSNNEKLLRMISNYSDISVPKNNIGIQDPTQSIFNFDYRTAHRLITKHIDWTPHFIRHMRMTIMSRDYKLSAPELQKFGGWASGSIAMSYVSADLSDIKIKMVQNTEIRKNERIKEIQDDWNELVIEETPVKPQFEIYEEDQIKPNEM